MFREPGIYSSVVTATVLSSDNHETYLTFTSAVTLIHVEDPSILPLSDLLGDDALVLPTPLISDTGFQVQMKLYTPVKLLLNAGSRIIAGSLINAGVLRHVL